MIVVIADDLTGGAEIAGVAWRYGCRVQLMMDTFKRPEVDCDVLVVATDIRSGGEWAAREMIEKLMNDISDDVRLFVKTDSAMRGHIVSELETIMRHRNCSSALLIAQNPSKGRIVVDGVYQIDGQPLHETAFRYDPEFPAHTSSVEALLKGCHSLRVDETLKAGINIGDASSKDDMVRQMKKTKGNTLLAGGADLFGVFLENMEREWKRTTPIPLIKLKRPCIVVCGSTQSSKQGIGGIADYCMPREVFHGADASDWSCQLEDAYKKKGSIIVRIGNETEGYSHYANRLKNTMAAVVCRLIGVRKPELLMIEGGATAYTILHQLQWTHLSVEEEVMPGVIRLVNNQETKRVSIIIKPGSYPWNVIQ